jgi:hypothetical protein
MSIKPISFIAIVTTSILIGAIVSLSQSQSNKIAQESRPIDVEKIADSSQPSQPIKEKPIKDAKAQAKADIDYIIQEGESRCYARNKRASEAAGDGLKSEDIKSSCKMSREIVEIRYYNALRNGEIGEP